MDTFECFAYESSRFTFRKDTKTFVAELSDLGNIGNGNKIGIRSMVTGNVVVYEYEHAEQDEDGDFTEFVFHPTADSVIEHPTAAGTKLVLLND